ncbi:hypothetical protein [Flavobacterium sp. LAR06]|uniref:hypothetical protein n=1 Tax=Flavobacterium sp. LAR06 TaxID=3064897 RepID=UPI0035BFC205
MADWAQVLIALVNLILAGYLLLYQRKKDIISDNNTALLNEQNIKLQWFKELVVQPNMNEIINFYVNLNTIYSQINSNELSDNEKQDINEFVKLELSKLRKSFVDVLFLIDKSFADQLMSNLDELIDGITNAIFDDSLKLKDLIVFEKNIGTKISISKNKIIAQLYNYKGLIL